MLPNCTFFPPKTYIFHPSKPLRTRAIPLPPFRVLLFTLSPPLQSCAFEAMFTREREHELFSPWGRDVPQNFRDDIVQRLEVRFDTLHPPTFGTYTL